MSHETKGNDRIISRRDLLLTVAMAAVGKIVFGSEQGQSSNAETPLFLPEKHVYFPSELNHHDPEIPIELIRVNPRIQSDPALNYHLFLPEVASAYSEQHIKGLCYSPYRDGQNPDWGPYPSIEEIAADIDILDRSTLYIRTYGPDHGMKNIPGLILKKESNIKVNAGCYIGPDAPINDALLADLIDEAKAYSNVFSVNIGNETQQFGVVSEGYLINCLNRVRQNVPANISISTGETWYQWLKRPALVQASDYILAHFFPYWEPNPVPIENAVGFIKQKYQLLKQSYPGKRIVIGEAGWPSAGETRGGAVPSLENQRRFITELLTWTEADNVDFCLFEAFDEDWKTRYEGEVGKHWGIYYSDRTPKFPGLTLK